jgi:C_GCAxxG_C_C family probable redox protein
MKKSDALFMPRREFVASLPFLMFGSRLFSEPGFARPSSRAFQELKEELTPAELKLVENSVLAQGLKNYFHNGYSCAESILMVSLKSLKKSEKLVWIASGFGGGVQHGDLCGFLTGGIMAIGLSSGKLNMGREAAKAICDQKVEEYWQWWASTAPLHCSEIRTENRTWRVCLRLGQLASVRFEELIKSE